MLIVFRTPAHADITMFGDIGTQLLKLMGMTGDVPGALNAEDVAAALQRLQRGVQPTPFDRAPASQKEDEEPPVSLRNRALPLIELLSAAATQGEHVMWSKT